MFLAPLNILHQDVANELGAVVVGRNTGHTWEQLDLPFYLSSKKNPPLLSLANTAPLAHRNNFVCIHDLAFYHHPEWNSKAFSIWYNVLIPRIAMGARHIFTVSETMKQEIAACYRVPPARISVTYNGIGSHLTMPEGAPVPEKELMILSVGTFNVRKNHQQLIKAYLASEAKHQYRLVIVGDKNKVFTETGIDEQQLTSNNITILQHLTDGELKTIYQKAAVVVSLSDYEGFGIPMLEGLYFGCRLLCSDIPVYHELFDGYASFCNQKDVQAITDALNSLCTNDDTFAGPDAGRLFEKYSYERSARTILSKIDPLSVLTVS